MTTCITEVDGATTGTSKPQPKRHCMVVYAHHADVRVQREAQALVKHGFEVDVLCLRRAGPRPEPPTETVNGVRIYRLPVTRSFANTGFLATLASYLAFFLHAMVALIRLHPRRRYEVVQVHNLPDFLVFAAWLPKLLGARVILDLHDLMPEFYASRAGHGMRHWLVRLVAWQERLSCRFADHVITVTDLWRDTLIRRGIPSGKVSVVMNVPDDAIFGRDDGSAAREGGFHLLYHGAGVRRYGIDLILEAVARLRDELPDLRCTIHSGRGDDYWEELTRVARDLGISDRVRFSGDYLPIEGLPGLIRTADVGVVPYRRDVFTDGILPTKLMEYVTLGVPAIVARTPVIERYFDDTMVEFFPAGDVDGLAAAIRRLYHDPDRRRALSARASAFTKRYNWQTQSASYVALVERLRRGGAAEPQVAPETAPQADSGRDGLLGSRTVGN